MPSKNKGTESHLALLELMVEVPTICLSASLPTPKTARFPFSTAVWAWTESKSAITWEQSHALAHRHSWKKLRIRVKVVVPKRQITLLDNSVLDFIPVLSCLTTLKYSPNRLEKRELSGSLMAVALTTSLMLTTSILREEQGSNWDYCQLVANSLRKLWSKRQSKSSHNSYPSLSNSTDK